MTDVANILKEVTTMAVTIDKNECVACGICAVTCPFEAITVDDVAVCDEDNCFDCSACIDACPQGAISME